MGEADRFVNEGVAVEPRDVPAGLIGVIAAALIGIVGLSAIAIMIAFPTALRGPRDAPWVMPAAPALQPDPAADYAAYRAAQDRELGSYGWVDKSREITRTPIDQAIREVDAEGIKDWPGDAK